jgi:hypothetical protein
LSRAQVEFNLKTRQEWNKALAEVKKPHIQWRFPEKKKTRSSHPLGNCAREKRCGSTSV